jgi:hypothetical protein
MPDAPAMALLHRKGSVLLAAAFDMLETNWPFEASFVLFCYNAVNFLGMQVGQNENANLEVGEPIVIDGLAADLSARIEGPGLPDMEIKASSSGSIRFPGTDRVGVYGVKAAEQPGRLFAVNLLDEFESSIEPQREIVISGQQIQAQEGALSRSNLPLWPFLVGAVLLLACVEWLVYNGKVRI